MLRIEQLRAAYGPVEALKGVDLEIAAGEIVTLIGANGAGKSTLLMSIFGRPRAAGGQILFEGRNITQLPTERVARLGIALVPEGRRIFPRMTVLENLRMGGPDSGLESVHALFPLLAERGGQRAGTLSGGEQQMLAIGRALMGRPRLLMLDEPSLGLAPLIVQRIFAAIGDINRDHGTTIFLVEQNAHHALHLAHRGYVLAQGRVVLAGESRALLNNPEIRAAYLGGG